MHRYHVIITMSDRSQGEHCDLYPHGAAAAQRAIELFPDADRIDVLRQATALQRLPGTHLGHQQPARREAA